MRFCSPQPPQQPASIQGRGPFCFVGRALRGPKNCTEYVFWSCTGPRQSQILRALIGPCRSRVAPLNFFV
jgi:hypothetical protein